jgi:hypothetical protein
MGANPCFISIEISANGISRNQHCLLGTHGWPRTFANEIGADPKNDLEEVVFKISTDLLQCLLTLYLSLHFFLT